MQSFAYAHTIERLQVSFPLVEMFYIHLGRWTSSIIPNTFEVCGYKLYRFAHFSHNIKPSCTRRHYPLLNELYRVVSNVTFNITIHICFAA